MAFARRMNTAHRMGIRVAAGIVAILLVGLGLGVAAAESFPQRIISNTPATTEFLFALGLGDRVVAVSDYCAYPPEVKKLPHIGGLLNPNLETALSLSPDLVIGTTAQRELRRKYEKLGVKFLPLSHDRLESVFTNIEKIGRATGVPDKADALAKKIRAELAATKARVEDKTRPRTLLVVGHQKGDVREVYVAGPQSFHGELLELAGGDNIFADLKRPEEPYYPNVSAEQIVARNPEVIIVISPDPEVSEKDVQMEKRTWARLATLAAVKSGRVALLPANPNQAPGPRVHLIAEQFANALHGN
ncbi:ABC transporter substrate-binding protein [bacterium]|nr:ABC transporter substrate-binding protein [bacterium]MCB9479820.1 ABC transporter substrate-binding protein [Deltaproteobacteria bacterium]